MTYKENLVEIVESGLESRDGQKVKFYIKYEGLVVSEFWLEKRIIVPFEQQYLTRDS